MWQDIEMFFLLQVLRFMIYQIIQSKHITLRHKRNEAKVMAAQLTTPIAVFGISVGSEQFMRYISCLPVKFGNRFYYFGNQQCYNADSEKRSHNHGAVIVFHCILGSFLFLSLSNQKAHRRNRYAL